MRTRVVYRPESVWGRQFAYGLCLINGYLVPLPLVALPCFLLGWPVSAPTDSWVRRLPLQVPGFEGLVLTVQPPLPFFVFGII